MGKEGEVWEGKGGREEGECGGRRGEGGRRRVGRGLLDPEELFG